MTLFKGNMKRLFLQRNGLILLAYILVISAIQFYTYNRLIITLSLLPFRDYSVLIVQGMEPKFMR